MWIGFNVFLCLTHVYLQAKAEHFKYVFLCPQDIFGTTYEKNFVQRIVAVNKTTEPSEITFLAGWLFYMKTTTNPGRLFCGFHLLSATEAW